MRNEFTLFKRGKYYHVKYVNPDGKSFTRKSVNVLYTALHGIGVVKITKAQAYLIARDALEKGLVFDNGNHARKAKGLLLNTYVRQIFDYENSDYIRQKLRAKSNSVTKSYCTDMLNAYMKHGAIYLENVLIADFKPYMAENIKDTLLDKGLSSSTINKVLQALRTALGEAYRKGLIDNNPSAGIQNINGEKRTRGIPTKEECTQLLEHLKLVHPAGRYERAAYLTVALAVYTGMRQGEIRALKPSDIQLLNAEESIINVAHAYSSKDGYKCPKGKKSRIVTAPTPLCTELLEYAKLSPNDYIFFSLFKDNEPVSSDTVRDWFFEGLENIGINKRERQARFLDFHSLRHFFSSCMNDVLSDDDRRKILGHSSIAMTDHYTHITPEYIEKMAANRAKAIPYI